MPSNTVPTFFCASIQEARDPQLGYASAGWTLAIHIEDLADDEDLERLTAAIWSRNRAEAIWEWISASLPGCAALVPKRRRASFMTGVLRAVDAGRV